MDLASYHGEVELSERPVTPDEIGKPLAEIRTGLGVRVYRDGTHFSHKAPEAAVLKAGDLIVEIVTG
jgi:voltage-gated potassium channel